MNYDQMLNVVTEMGRILLQNGAEIHRVEESMQRICLAYGLADSGVFAISTCIHVSFQDETGRNYSRIKRIRIRGIDLDRVERANALCREICADTPPLGEVERRIQKLEEGKIYPFWVRIGGSVLVGGAFSLLFGGSLPDACVAAVCGGAIRLVVEGLNRWKTNFMLVNFAASAVGAALAVTAAKLGAPIHTDTVIIGALMNLVPGGALTNVMRDLLAEDFISGLLKLAEALLIATAIALGTGFTMWALQAL